MLGLFKSLAFWFLVRLKTGIPEHRLKRIRKHIRIRTGREAPLFTDELQKPYAYFPGLYASAWHNPSDFAWTKSLSDAFPIIRTEYEALRKAITFAQQHQGLTTGGDWNVFYFYTYGHKIEENCKKCPETARIIEAIPGATSAGLAYFSILTPGAKVAPHFGPTNVRLRLHFGLSVPAESRIRVGREVRSWKEGESILFDDSFEHEVWNSSDQPRVVLIIDFWHPELTPEEVMAMKVILSCSSRTKNIHKLAQTAGQP